MITPTTYAPRSKWHRVGRYTLTVLIISGTVGSTIYLRHWQRERQTRKFIAQYSKRDGEIFLIPIWVIPPYNYGWGNGCVDYINEWYRESITRLSKAPILNSDLKNISQFQDLEALRVPQTPLSSGLIDCLAGLPKFQELRLSHSEATDETLGELCHALEKHPGFTILTLEKSHITEAGMRELRRLQNLKFVKIESPHVNDPVASFQATRQSPMTLQTPVLKVQ